MTWLLKVNLVLPPLCSLHAHDINLSWTYIHSRAAFRKLRKGGKCMNKEVLRGLGLSVCLYTRQTRGVWGHAPPGNFWNKACSEINSDAFLAWSICSIRYWSCIYRSSIQTVYCVEFCVIVYLHMCLLTICNLHTSQCICVSILKIWGGGGLGALAKSYQGDKCPPPKCNPA